MQAKCKKCDKPFKTFPCHVKANSSLGTLCPECRPTMAQKKTCVPVTCVRGGCTNTFEIRKSRYDKSKSKQFCCSLACSKAWKAANRFFDHKAYHKAYRAAHPEKWATYEQRRDMEAVKQYRKEYWKRNKVKETERAKRYQKSHAKELSSKNKVYRQIHKEHIKLVDNISRQRRKERDPERAAALSAARHRRSKTRHPERFAARDRNNKASRRGAEGHHSAADIANLFKRQHKKCAACKAPVSDKKGAYNKYEVDHVIAIKNGGSNWPDNLQLLCAPCNRKKRDMDDLVWANRHGLLFC